MVKPHLILSLTAALLSAGLASCSPTGLSAAGDVAVPVSPQAAGTAAQPASTQVAAEPNPMNATPYQAPLDDATAGSVKLATEDLARRLGVTVEGVIVNAVLGQEFSVDAFYCRAPKERIAKEDPPQPISGLSIVLTASARRYEYHARGQEVFFCRPLF